MHVPRIFRRLGLTAVLAVAVAGQGSQAAVADHTTPGQAGKTKVFIYDNTDNGWNVTTPDPGTGGPDPEIGFVNFRPTVPGDPNHIKLVVAPKNAAPNCTLQIQLITSFPPGNTDAGLAPDGNHSGLGDTLIFFNIVGSVTTNAQGRGNSGEITVDVTTLLSPAPPGTFTYAHVDLNEPTGTCMESDGTSVANNEYGASGHDPTVGPPPGPANIHWLQP